MVLANPWKMIETDLVLAQNNFIHKKPVSIKAEQRKHKQHLTKPCWLSDVTHSDLIK